jgi:hypothetical protein
MVGNNRTKYYSYDKKTGIDWKWQSMDGVITKAP